MITKSLFTQRNFFPSNDMTFSVRVENLKAACCLTSLSQTHARVHIHTHRFLSNSCL